MKIFSKTNILLNNSFKGKIIVLVLFLLFIDALNLNYAMVTNNIVASSVINTPKNIYEKEVPYVFMVSDKLTGYGVMKVTIEKDIIKGVALGKGMTCKYDIDFESNFEGTLNSSKGDVNVVLKGQGIPLKIPFKSKIQFNGPLKGFYKQNKLKLVGKVNIKGVLAKYAGCKKKEEVLIEVTENIGPIALIR